MQPSIFIKPIEEISSADLDELIVLRFPEGPQFDMKRSVRDRPGDESWLDGGKLSGDAKREIGEMVIAFANSIGGLLVIGLDEDREEAGNVASKIALVPRCKALADVIADSIRDSVKPKLATVTCIGVEVEGTSGCVVIRIGASRDAPHSFEGAGGLIVSRRIGSSSQRLTIREIRELILTKYREEEERDLLFTRSGRAFDEALDAMHGGHYPDEIMAVGFRASAIPVYPLSLPRLVGNQHAVPPLPDFVFVYPNGSTWPVETDWRETEQRPILRGVRRGSVHFGSQPNGGHIRELREDGSIDVWTFCSGADGGRCFIQIEEAICAIGAAIASADFFRLLGQNLDVEYILEVALGGRDFLGQAGPFKMAVTNQRGNKHSLLEANAPYVFPRYLLAPRVPLITSLSIAVRDLFDHLAIDRPIPTDIRVRAT